VRRRSFVGGLPFLLCPGFAFGERVAYPQVRPGYRLQFPRDHGAHPDFRTEWWYVTGWLEEAMGFQVTFFRARPEEESNNPSSFNPRQILFAHAAIADPKRGRLVHEERAARAGLSLAQAELGRTAVWIDDWRLEMEGDRYRARIPGRELDLDLAFVAPGAPLLQGENGLSRKGRRPEEASYYYSRPHLAVAGKLDGREVKGEAWLDHEWSSAYLAPEAVGWDWCGINLFNGGSLMAFRMRDRAGKTYYAPPGVSIVPLRTWRSPRTGVSYPVSMQVNDLRLEPLMDDQELDARASSGTIYWEGAVTAYKDQIAVGHGYLELTGYWKPMKL
jgi:predicted secreted hydrolase